MDARVVAWRGVGVRVPAHPAALDLLEQHPPLFYGGPARVVAQARLSSTDRLDVELPDGLSVSGPDDSETFRAAASWISCSSPPPCRTGSRCIPASPSPAGRSWSPAPRTAGGPPSSRPVSKPVRPTWATSSPCWTRRAGSGPFPRQLTLRTKTGTTLHLPERSVAVTNNGLEVALVADLAWSTGGWQVEAATRG